MCLAGNVFLTSIIIGENPPTVSPLRDAEIVLSKFKNSPNMDWGTS